MGLDMSDLKAVKGGDVDLEMGPANELLYPGIGLEENELRLGFINKVYGIIGAQLVLTLAVASCFALIPSVQQFVLGSQPFIIVAILLPFITMVPMYCYRHSHPWNLGFLALWTAAMSVMVGVGCSAYKGPIIIEALVLTAVTVLSLTAYTFWAARRGGDFSHWGGMLFSGLMILIFWGFIQIFFSPGPVGEFVFALVGAVLFSAFIVYDTESLIKRFSYDEYVWASVGLYLDVLNLFIHLLEILRYVNGSR